jgi:2,3-bisphosphoglycerate-independent phosphoglycerate mutase
MVGHTGKLESTVIAVETVDVCLGRILPVIAELKGALIVTADHGNADQMFELDKKTKKAQVDEKGKPRAKTSHTLNPVPFYIYAPTLPALRIDAAVPKPRLANVAATTLQLMGYEPPADFERGLLAR